MEDREFQDPRLEVGTAVYPPGRLQPTSLSSPRGRRWLKITLRPSVLQRAARAAKGKDNVLAALIGVCGCHILITPLKKKKKKKVMSRYSAKDESKSLRVGHVGFLFGDTLQTISSWNATG